MFKSIVFWMTFPFVIPQALRVKRQAPRFADAQGGNKGLIGSGKPIHALGIGDSIINGVGTSHMEKSWIGQTFAYLSNYCDYKIYWQKLAKTGAKLEEINYQFLSQTDKPCFDFILISVGVNDVTGLTSLPKWQTQLRHLLNTLQKNSPQATIIISGVPPMHVFPLLPQPLRFLLGLRAKMFDKVIEKTIKTYERILHIPIEIELDPKNFSDDGYHPSEYGCKKWGEKTAQTIVEELS